MKAKKILTFVFLFICLFSGISSGLLSGLLNGGVDSLHVVLGDGNDHFLGDEVLDAGASEGAVDLEAVGDDRCGNELVLGNITLKFGKHLYLSGRIKKKEQEKGTGRTKR